MADSPPRSPGPAKERSSPGSQSSPPRLPISLTRNPERENLPKELLAEYEPVGEDLLGEGAFAVVRLMRHIQSEDLYALKCVEKHPLRIRNMIEQMQREVRIQQNLSHPNILRLVRAYDDQFYVYLLLEYCKKGPLRDLICHLPNHRLDEPPAAFYFEQIGKGVAWMHRNHCVHRDLKLENMLLTEQDVVKICDFGWSAEMEIEKMLKTTCGTTAYWAPEIWESAEQDESVDMWALGCMLYEMLAGHAPFHDQDQNRLKQKVLSVEFGYPPWFTNEACHTVHILLQRSAAKRVKCEDLLKHPWLSKYKEKPEQSAAEALPSQTAVVEPASSRAVVPQPTEPQVLGSISTSHANGRAPSFVARLGPTVAPAPRRIPVEAPLLSYTGQGSRPSSVAPTSPPRSTSMKIHPTETMLAATANAHRFASPGRSPAPMRVSRSKSPMHRAEEMHGGSPFRLEAMHCPTPLAAQIAQQATSFGFEFQETPLRPGTQTYGGAVGSLGPSSLHAARWESGAQGFVASVGMGSAMLPQSPAGGSGSSMQGFGAVLERDSRRDLGNSWRGARRSSPAPARHLPPPPSALSYPCPTTPVNSGPQWQGMHARDFKGAVPAPALTQRLPVPQPVTLPQSQTPMAHTRANLPSTPTATTARAAAASTPYGLPHSRSGRLATMAAPMGSFMVVPQPQQQVGYNSAFGVSPRRSAVVS